MRTGKTRRMGKQAPAGLRHFRSFATGRLSEGAQMNYSKAST